MRCRSRVPARHVRPLLLAGLLPLLIGAAGPPVRIAGEVGGPVAELCLAPAPAHDFGAARPIADPPAGDCAQPIPWDAQGRFAVAAQPGQMVQARFDGVGSFSAGPLAAGAELPRLAPRPPSPFEVAVADLAGRPVIGARVFVDATTSPLPPWRADRRSALTDSTGRVRLPVWEGEKLEISVVARYSIAWQSKPDFVPDGRVFLAQVIPQRPRTVQVLSALAQPQAGTAVFWNGLPLGLTDAQGRLEVTVSPAADLYLYDRRNGGWWLPAAAWQERKTIETVAGGRLIAAGRVFDPEGRPARGARVQLQNGRGQAAAEATTGEDGFFRFGALAAAEYRLRASLPGFADALAEMHLGAECSGRVAAPDLLLGLGQEALGGRVIDRDGAPVAGAEIRVLRELREPAPGSPPGGTPDAHSGNDGFYLVGGIKPGEQVALEFRAPGLLPQLLPGIVADGARDLDVALEPAAALEVEVVDPGGMAVAGATLDLTAGEDAPQPLSRSLSSGADGKVFFAELPVGGYEIELKAPGFIRGHLRLRLEAGVQQLPVELETGATLAGTFRDEMGNPIEGAFVSLRDPRAPTRVLASAQTDAEGRFHVAGIPQGSWRLEAAAPRRPPLIDVFEAARLEDYERDLDLPPGEAVRGVVLDAGLAPVAGAQVTILETSQGVDGANNPHGYVRALAVTSTDAAGAFLFERLARRRYSLAVRGPGGAAATQSIEAGGAEPFVEIVLMTPRIQ